jgi:hypothetical protein
MATSFLAMFFTFAATIIAVHLLPEIATHRGGCACWRRSSKGEQRGGRSAALPSWDHVFAFIAMALLTVGFKSKPSIEQAQTPPQIGHTAAKVTW